MIDPLLSLAFAVHSNRGVYALLLGSGVSRAAQIPTGWEITLALVNKLAAVQKEPNPADPVGWYRKKYGREPHYSELIDAVSMTREERMQLLRSYFEPTEDEREAGVKMPTAAHRAIASLVASGHIRVILTTNFDRLIERAIEDEGISPTVLSTPDMIGGAVPLAHQRCVVVKLHGDYLDPRILNTESELAAYDKRVDVLLDRVFDEYGLIICGWSAEWDIALPAALNCCPTRRFGTFWASRGKLGSSANQLVKQRAATQLTIADADSFFTELADKIQSLSELDRPHPLTIATAAATTKRFLAEDRHRLRLNDLIQSEAELLYERWQEALAVPSGTISQAQATRLCETMLSASKVFISIVCHCGVWGKSEIAKHVADALSRLESDPLVGQSGVHVNRTIRSSLSALLLQAISISALSSGNYDLVVSVFKQFSSFDGSTVTPFVKSVDWGELDSFFKLLADHKRDYFPFSEWSFNSLREPLRSIVPNDWTYGRLFDSSELLRILCFVEVDHPNGIFVPESLYGVPGGRFVYLCGGRRQCWEPFDEFLSRQDNIKKLAEAGLFAGNEAAVGNAVKRLKELISKWGLRY